MNERGLTLIELLVAMTIAGLALAAGYGMLTTLLDNRERFREATYETARASALRTTLISWLEGARVTGDASGPRYRGIDGRSDDIPNDEIRFLTSADTPLGSAETIVHLYIDRDPDTSASGLVARFSEYLGTATATRELAPEVAGLEAEYFSRVLGSDRWMPSWISSSVLPAAVRVRLVPEDGRELPPLLQLPLVVPTMAAI